MVSEESWIYHPSYWVVTQVGDWVPQREKPYLECRCLPPSPCWSQLEHHGASHLYSNDGAVWLWPKVESPSRVRALMRVRGDIKTPPGETSDLPEPLNTGLLASNLASLYFEDTAQSGAGPVSQCWLTISSQTHVLSPFLATSKRSTDLQTQHYIWPAHFGHSLHLPIILQHLFLLPPLTPAQCLLILNS